MNATKNSATIAATRSHAWAGSFGIAIFFPHAQSAQRVDSDL
jgi:hypothetical protein